MVINTKVLYGIIGGSGVALITAGSIAGAYYLKPSELIKKIRSLSDEDKKSGKIFQVVEHNWKEDGLTPYTLFKCVNESCEDIPSFNAIFLEYGNSLTQIFYCEGVTDKTMTPFYYFDQELKANATPLDLDWSKLKRATSAARKFGQYLVIKITKKNSCQGEVKKATVNADSKFWREKFDIKKAWDSSTNYSKDLSVFLRINGRPKQYWWRPIAPLAHDFDAEAVASELQKYKTKTE